MYFETADIIASPILLMTIAFSISLVCSTAGISGAFLLLPIQISVLGYIAPGVSATNQIYNIFSCPGGIYRYYREDRLLFPLVVYILAGTIPGGIVGTLLRISILSNPHYFYIFAGCMLFYLALRLCTRKGKAVAGIYKLISFNFSSLNFEFSGNLYHISLKSVIIPGFFIGIAGGAYGVGGGAFMVPYLASILGLPMYIIAGASLLATFATSVSGVIFYYIFSDLLGIDNGKPDLLLGLFLGIGGICGMYCGAFLQRYIPERYIRILLSILTTFISLYYIYKFLIELT